MSQWIRRISRKNWKPSKTSVVCDLHFRDCDFNICKSDRPIEFRKRRLNSSAVPTLHLRGDHQENYKQDLVRTTRNSQGIVYDTGIRGGEQSNSPQISNHDAEDTKESSTQTVEDTEFMFRQLRLQLRESKLEIEILKSKVLTFERLSDDDVLV